jgi:hypothetical protein
MRPSFLSFTRANDRPTVIHPMCSDTVLTGLTAWVNALRDLRSLNWVMTTASQATPSIIVTDSRHLDQALHLGRVSKTPVALWGTDSRADGIPQLALPCSVDGFMDFSRACDLAIDRSRTQGGFLFSYLPIRALELSARSQS